MKSILRITSLAALMFAVLIALNARTTAGKADNYHYAMNLCLQHTADNAKILFDQASKGEFNQEMLKDFVDRIGKDIDQARIYHARLHRVYTEAESQLISEEHTVILSGQTKAAEAFALLKTELEKTKPSADVIKIQTAAIFDGTTKAVAAHRDAMKKLGVTEMKNPAL